MKAIRRAVALFLLLFATGYSQQTSDTDIKSLQISCNRHLQVRHDYKVVRVKLAVAEDGSVASAEALRI